MPLKPCIRNLHKTYMHFEKEDWSETYVDINGRSHPRHRIYQCDCREEHTLDIYQNIWLY